MDLVVRPLVLGLLLAGLLAGARRGPAHADVLYGWGELDPVRYGGMQALELPSGRLVGQTPFGGATQGGGFAFSPDPRRAFALDAEWLPERRALGWRLTELELPSLRVVRRTPVADAIPLLGIQGVVAVAADGRSVYVETMRIVGPNRFDARLGVGQPESAYGVAVYDIAQGAFVGEVPLAPPWCGVAELHPLPDGRLAVFCGLAHEVRLIDPMQGKQVASVGVDGIASAASSDGRRLWAVDLVGGVHEVDLGRMAVVRETQLGSDRGDPSVPAQELHATADGARLFVRAAPGDAELRATGNGSEVWVVDTATLRRVAVVPLPAPAFHLAPSPDGRMLVAVTNNVPDRGLFGTRLLEVPSGREVAGWPGALAGPRVRRGPPAR
jgi:DNA-binding beta-propeller fold protein YncE